jgi:hypothetical protein
MEIGDFMVADKVGFESNAFVHLCNGSLCFDFAFEVLGCGGIVKSSDPEIKRWETIPVK